MMQILGFLGMYFDAAVVFVTNSSLLFRLATTILWNRLSKNSKIQIQNIEIKKIKKTKTKMVK